MSFYIGIDLGTTYSAVAYVAKTGTPVIIQTTQDSVTTPSAVYIDEDGELLIGEDAKSMQKSKGQVATFYKRNIGQSANNYYLEDGKSYSAIDLSSIFLKELVKRTEESMGQKVDGAVITVPAYFTEHEKRNTKMAAEKAGINVLHMVNEPTAAAVAYGLDKTDNKKILVYDLGGGTFDVSVAQIDKDRIRIIATVGHHQLGGKDWDLDICNWAADKFREQFGDDFSTDPEQMDALMIDAEKLKRRLTKQDKGEIRVKYEGHLGKFILTEKEFRQRTRPLLERTGDLINQMFSESKLSWKDIDDVILVGGSTRMRMIEDYIPELYGKSALRGIQPDEAVALGAALLAKSISDQLNNFSLAGQDQEFELVVGNKTVNDVNSHSLGLIAAREEKIKGDLYNVFYNEIMIPKNTSLEEAKMTKRFQLNSDVQDIYLTQWESDSLPDPEAIIGKYQVYDIKANQPFSVTYYHNADGTVDISAEQDGRKLRVQKVLDYADRDFEPEEARKPSKGVIMIAIDLSGSMSVLCDEDEEFKSFLYRADNDGYNFTSDELEQLSLLERYLDLCEKKEWTEIHTFSAKMWYSALGMTKKAIADFIEQFPAEYVSFGMIGFADKIKEFAAISKDRKSFNRAISELSITDDTGIANRGQPMTYMFDKLKAYKSKENLDFAYAVVLTDGCWHDSAAREALLEKKKYIREGFEIIVQGFGEANEEFIRELATIKELSGVGSITELSQATSNIATVIADKFSLTK